MIENYSIEFNTCAFRYASQRFSDDNERNRMVHRLSKDNVAQVVIFDSVRSTSTANSTRTRQQQNNSYFCVVNTHLYSNPKFADVKLWQTMTLLQEIETFLSQRDMALLLCGDFNSEPSSIIYQLLSTGSVDSEHPEMETLANSPVLPDPKKCRHHIEMASAMVTATGSEPLFTNYTVLNIFLRIYLHFLFLYFHLKL